MDSIKVLDKTFKRYVSCEDLDKHVAELAAKLNHDFAGKEVLFLGILNGSFIFASDLIRKLDLNCQITFVKLASYEGTESTGEVRQIIGLNENIKGKTVIIIEDIVDSGLTLETIIDRVQPFEPEEIKIATIEINPEIKVKSIETDHKVALVRNQSMKELTKLKIPSVN